MSTLTPHPFIPSDHEIDPGALPAAQAMLIELEGDDGDSLGSGAMEFVEGADGAMELLGDGQMEILPESGHDDNLAENMDEGALSTIATQIEEWVRGDIDSRKDWHDRLADGLRVVGLINDPDTNAQTDDPFKHVEKVSHPLIAEACVQFQARAIAELVPAGGPVKAMVLGERTKEAEEQATRVAEYMNYALMVVDGDFYPETDAMLFTLALEGSQFKKTYHDTLTGQNVSRHIRPENFIVPYGARSLKNAPRYTHQISVSRNDLRKLQAGGAYRKVELALPSEGPVYNDKIKDARDHAQGQEESLTMYDDTEHTVWECHCDYDVPGFEDPDGIGRPYIISVEKESMKVLSIRRNWDEADEKMEKVVSFVHYPYMPGDGFYSYGLLHLIGGLGKAATGLLKTILMGAGFSAVPGGFKSKDAKISGNPRLAFGKFIDTDMTADELKSAFFQLNFKEPGEALFKILGFITEAGQRFSSTTENMVGDANNNGPVGTTVALIEQGSKVFSGNHKRLHYAQGQEFQQLARLHGKHVPDEGYPYNVPGEELVVYRADFNDRVDVVPVSDPNIFSSTQRIAIWQGVRQMAMEQPGEFNMHEVTKSMLEAMRVPDPDRILIDHDKIRRRDPITENMCMMNGIPVRALEDQDHAAHYAVCLTEIQRIEGEKNPAMMQQLPAFYAHLAQHKAYLTRLEYAMAMGIQLPPVDLYAEASPEDDAEEIDPAMEAQISQLAAQAIAKLPKPPMPGSPEEQQRMQELEQREQAVSQQEQAAAQEMEKIREAQVVIDKMTQEVNNDRRLQALETQLHKAQIDLKRTQDELKAQQQRHEAQGMMDKAVGTVQGALDQKARGDADAQHKRDIEDAKKETGKKKQ